MQRLSRALGLLDGGVVLSTAFLVAAGIVMLYSATAPLALGERIPPHFLRQLGAVAVALMAALAALAVPTPAWRRLAWPGWGAGIALLVATALAGDDVNGARRWLTIPGVGLAFQPGELAKWATLVAVAAQLGRAREQGRLSPRRLAPCLLLVGLPTLFFLAQPDLGSAVVLVALAGLLVFVAGAPLRLFAVPAAAGAAGVLVYVLVNDYARRRVTGFLDPWATASNEGFQLVQSFVAFGSGGLFGRNLGDGRQKLFYLPEAHTDFILSLVAEETGLLGVCLVLGAFAALAVAGLRIALRARDSFAMLLAVAMTALLTVPALLNAAVVMGVVPTKGLTLPFLSYGRTSLVVSFLAVGVLLGIGRREGRAPAPQVARAERRRSWTR
jgi:cell division protein FtsW